MSLRQHADALFVSLSAERDATRLLTGQRDTLLFALQAARECIETDRTSLADCHMRPDNTLDAEGESGVAEYDAVLTMIDDAIAKATP